MSVAPFIQRLEYNKIRNTRVINQLQFLLHTFPTLIVHNDKSLCYYRGTIKKLLAEKYKDFNLDFFERGLKHLGLIVVRSTNKHNKIKKWRFKDDDDDSSNEEDGPKRKRRALVSPDSESYPLDTSFAPPSEFICDVYIPITIGTSVTPKME